MKILILCTGNSCRSQMAQAALRYYAPGHEICSAGTQPVATVHPLAIDVMAEVGLDLSSGYDPKHVDCYLGQTWDWVITVCDGARETCPVFLGQVKNRIHIGFEDPALFNGTSTEVRAEFVRVRDEILKSMQRFAQSYIAVEQQEK